MRRAISGVILIFLLANVIMPAFDTRSARALEEADTVILVTTMGNITVELFGDMPITAGNFKNLTKFGVYDGTLFHRVVPGFVIQGGDATTKGITVPPIPDELPNKHSNVRGSVAMAKTSQPNSATSQFYINLNDTNVILDSYYSVFGTVIAGMDVVDAISHVPIYPPNDGRPVQDVTILKAQLSARADVPTLDAPIFELLDKQSMQVKGGVDMKLTFRNVGYLATVGTVWIPWEKVNYAASLEGSPPSGNISEAILGLDVNGDSDESDAFSIYYVNDTQVEVDGVIANAMWIPEQTFQFNKSTLQVQEKTNFTLGSRTHSLYAAEATYARFALDTFFRDHPSPNIEVIIYQLGTSKNIAPTAEITRFKFNGTILPYEFNWVLREFLIEEWSADNAYVYPLGFLDNGAVFSTELCIRGAPGSYGLNIVFNWAPDTIHRYRYILSDTVDIPFNITTAAPRVSLGAWTFHPPTIDGIISNSEWHHAAQVEFVMGNVSGMIYEMNDETNLYLGVKLNESFPDLFKIVFEFDNDNDGHDPMQGEDLIFASYTSEFIGTDAYWDSNRSDFMQDPIHDLQYMVNKATSSVEFSKPLYSGDPHDFALHAGDNVGFQMSYWHSNLKLVGSFPGNRTGSGFPGHGTGDHGVHSTFGQISIAEEGPACGIPVLISLLEISPGTPYYVGDTLTAEFTIKNVGDAAITLDKLLVGGRFDGGTLPNGLFPDFTNESVTLQPGQSHMYEGALELTEAGNYHFFVAYYIENPTAEEKNLLDENNWNTCVQLGEGLTDADRVRGISVLEHAPPPNQPPSPPTLLSQYRLDGGEIPVKDPVDERQVKFAAVVEDPDGDQVRLQAELRRIDEYGGQFDETKGGLKESPLFDSGGVATIEVYDLIRGQYHWRARTIDEHGMFSDWYDFGNNDVKEPDFIVCNKFRIVYPEGWMNLQLFVPVGYSPIGYLDKIKFDLQNRKDMWYKITVSRRAPGGSWKDITDTIWKVPYIGPYSAATEPLLYSPIGGEEIRINVKDDPEDEILWALKVVDILARALTGKPAPPAILDVAGERPLLTFWKDVIFPLGLNYVKGEFWDYVGDLCKAAAEYMIRHDLASVFIDQGFTTETAAEIISVVNVVAAEGIYALYKLAKFIVVSKDLFSNMGALPNQEESVILTIVKRPTSTVTPNLVLTEGLHVIQEGPYYQGANIKACFSIKNVGLLAVNLHALTVGGRTEEGYVRDFPFETDVAIDPGETYRYEGELTLLHAGRNCFFVALQVEDDEWVTSVPTKVGLVNNLYVDVEPVQIVMSDNLCSPGELRVYDHQGRVTGLVAGETRCEIPHSFYYDDTIIIFYPEDNLTHCVVGTGDGTYNLEIAYVDNGETTLFNAINLSTSSSAVHEYSIGWAALSRGEEGVTVQIDSNGDGTFEKTFTAGSELTRGEFMLQVFPLETFPLWIAGVAVAAIAIVTIAIAVFWRKRKQPSTKKR
jgi:peptidylprolyl isomerase